MLVGAFRIERKRVNFILIEAKDADIVVAKSSIFNIVKRKADGLAKGKICPL